MWSPAPFAASAIARISVWRLMNRKPGPSGWTQPVVKNDHAQSASRRRIRKRVPLIKMERFYRGERCGSKLGNGSIDWKFQFVAATVSVVPARCRRYLIRGSGRTTHTAINFDYSTKQKERPPISEGSP